MNGAAAKELLRRGRLYCFLLASIPFFSGCNAALPEPGSAERVRDQCPDASHEEFYFTSGAVIPASAVQDRQQRDAYSRFLRPAKVGSFSCGALPAEAYRLLWIDYGPAVLIEITPGRDQSWELGGYVFKHPSTNDRWSIEKRIHHRVANDDVRRLAGSLTDARFWTRPSWQSSSADDGGILIVEARVTSGYRVVSMAEPVEEAFYDAARQFFALARLDAPETVVRR